MKPKLNKGVKESASGSGWGGQVQDPGVLPEINMVVNFMYDKWAEHAQHMVYDNESKSHLTQVTVQFSTG